MANSCDTKSDFSEPSEKDRRVPPLYPVVLGSPETTLDIDSGSATSESEEWTQEVAIPNGNGVLPQSSTINVENSSDVVIGPLTQFHGPVTIYQNINSDSSSSPAISGVECKSDIILNSADKLVSQPNNFPKRRLITKHLKRSSHKRLPIYIAIVLTMLAAAIATLVITLKPSSEEESPMRSPTTYSRREWGARPPFNSTTLCHPTEYVIISHTETSFCTNLDDCAFTLQKVQAMHMTSGSMDIGYNFMIGGDGAIYVGRGWDTENFHDVNNIGISFVGNFTNDLLTSDMISTLQMLLDRGVQLEKMPVDYKLVFHNQTTSTLSPGAHVYEEIAKFSNFYTGSIDFHENQNCSNFS